MSTIGQVLTNVLGPGAAHVVLALMGVGSLCAHCAAAIHAAWHAGAVDLGSFGGGAAAIIVATGGALGMGVKRDAS